MLLYCDYNTDPCRNLAAEEYLLTNVSEPLLRLWRNSDSVIVGRNQNALAEIDSDFAANAGIPVVRRLSGGGAVFHDLGNVNYSFFNLEPSECTNLIISALAKLGLRAETSGRNDILIDGKKVSGTAGCKQGSHTLHHGTLLFSSSISKLSEVLRPRPEKFEGKAVKSVSSRVTNISEHLSKPMTVEEFFSFLAENIAPDARQLELSQENVDGIEALRRDRYAACEWNFGKSPAYSFSKVKRFSAGFVEVFFNVKSGVIADLDIRGDYFFSRPTEEFCRAMAGCPHDREKIAGRLSELATGEYFIGIAPEELLPMFF